MKFLTVVVIILMSVLNVSCSRADNQQTQKSLSSDEQVKSCATNTDCSILYNVNYKGKCSAGCFNKNSKIDETCTVEWSKIPGSCECVNKICTWHKE